MAQTSLPIDIVQNGPTWLTVRVNLAGIAPETAMSWFTDRDKLLRWWGQGAEIDPVPGGIYEVRWPAMDWTMRGEIVEITPTTFIYSWSWIHEPELPARVVIVRTASNGDDTVVTLSQGPYRQGDAFPGEDEDRQSHLDGWSNFLPALQQAIATAATTP